MPEQGLQMYHPFYHVQYLTRQYSSSRENAREFESKLNKYIINIGKLTDKLNTKLKKKKPPKSHVTRKSTVKHPYKMDSSTTSRFWCKMRKIISGWCPISHLEKKWNQISEEQILLPILSNPQHLIHESTLDPYF